MKSEEIRQKFLDFFKTKKHAIYPSSSLVPDDPTMLLTTAGMVQFKPFFEGEEKSKDKRIATSQKCARTTDIDRVGHTARHLTFFEMLGNFSFGDYYKKDSIIWAWELLTEVYKLDKNKLWATIFNEDDEAFEAWQKNTDVDKNRIARQGLEHNFWKAGDIGPCGPSSEIIYDFGEEHSCGPKCVIGCDCDRWLEIWNLVFMQNECLENGSLKELPKKNIDTGMGLERITAILQNAKDNFHTDLLKPILDYVSKATNTKLGEEERKDVSLKVITD
ncbi:MAG: alanine--tRNA ligase, partial [Actinobacteria bacterium]